MAGTGQGSDYRLQTQHCCSAEVAAAAAEAVDIADIDRTLAVGTVGTDCSLAAHSLPVVDHSHCTAETADQAGTTRLLAGRRKRLV